MEITNEFIQQQLQKVKPYCLFILKAGPTRNQPDAEQIQWEHVRYLLQLREEGRLLITCPIMGETDTMGVGILNTADVEEVKMLLNEDPNVKAGRMTYEIHVCMSFPGDALK